MVKNILPRIVVSPHNGDEMGDSSVTKEEFRAALVLLNLSPICKVPTAPNQSFEPATRDSTPALLNEQSGRISNSDRSCGDSEDESFSSSNESIIQPYVAGSISLALNEDREALSPLHCFMRRYCVEAFSAGEEDLVKPRYGKSHGGRIMQGQVGIRCIHCKHRPLDQRKERAVCFPSSIKNIYHSIETFQRRHSLVCEDLPPWIKKSMTNLMKRSKSGAGGRRQYWEESAQKLGMIDSTNGVRFSRNPGLPFQFDNSDNESSQDSSLSVNKTSIRLVYSEDKALVTEYLFLLLDQMESSRFSEQDRSGGRSKVKDRPVGFPGMQCKHCGGKSGLGRYFPATRQALTSANSDRNIFNHIIKCSRCPRQIRDKLVKLQGNQQHFKNRRGLRKAFFERIWKRLHASKINYVHDDNF